MKTWAECRYKDLDINQRINLKAMIWTDPALRHLQVAWLMFGPVRTVNFLFAHDERMLLGGLHEN